MDNEQTETPEVAPIIPQDIEPRFLEYGGDFVEQEKPDPVRVARAHRLIEFFGSPEFADIQYVMNEVVGRYAVPTHTVTTNPPAYQLFNVVRDVFQEFIVSLGHAAALAQTEDLPENGGF